MCTEVAFFCGVICWVYEYSVIRTSSNAGFTANANIFIKIYYAVFTLIHGGYWASGNARRIFALITAGYLKVPACVRKNTNLYLFYVGAVNAERYFVFAFAGNGASVTAYTTCLV